MRNNNTYIALLTRGLSSDIAKKLVEEKYTLSGLKQMNKDELRLIGLTDDFIDKLYDEDRPPIPEMTLDKLLHESKYTCCICRDSSKPIIVHHIEPWETSRSHKEENLVVLCLEHHSEAHTKHDLAINLTAERLKTAKETWQALVKEQDMKTVLDIVDTSKYVCWDYFNINRLFEISEGLKIIYSEENKYYQVLLERGLIDIYGFIKPSNLWTNDTSKSLYWLDFMYGNNVSYYLANIFIKILSHVKCVFLNKIWNKTSILSTLKIGDFVMLQGAFYFKELSKNNEGPNQRRKGYRRAYGIRVEFEFDAWYSCSSTAHNVYLSKRFVETMFGTVRAISKEKDEIIITCSVLALGSSFNEVQDGRYILGPIIESQDNDSEFEDFDEVVLDIDEEDGDIEEMLKTE